MLMKTIYDWATQRPQTDTNQQLKCSRMSIIKFQKALRLASIKSYDINSIQFGGDQGDEIVEVDESLFIRG